METPHIKFTWSSDALATILDTIEVQGLGSANKTTGLYSTWPDQEQWALYSSKLMQWMPTLLSDEERETLEKKLSAVESAFNTYLSQPNADNKDQRITQLRELLKQLEEIEALICDRGSHAAYPYFARWFTLNIAAIREFMNYENRLGEVQGVKIWWDGLNYLGKVFYSAYAERAKQVTISFTGAFHDRVYVWNQQTGTPLTIDVKRGTEDEIAILNIQRFLQSEAGWQYIQNISLEENFKILEQVRNAVVVTTDSPTKQDEVFDISKSWRERQEAMEYKIAENRKACEPDFDRLINHAARQQSLPDVKAGTKALRVQQRTAQRLTSQQQAIKDAFINAYRPLVIATARTPEEKTQLERDFPGAIDIVAQVVPDLLGMIPIIGDIYSTIFGVFFMFLGKESKPNPWVEFEKKVRFLIREAVTDTVADNIRNSLTGFDNRLRNLILEYQQHSTNMTASKRAELINRANALLDNLLGFRPQILTPASNAYFKTAPYYQHFFLTYLAALEVAKTFGVETPALVLYRTELYEETATYISNACLQIAVERRNDIYSEWKDDKGGQRYLITDRRSNRVLKEMEAAFLVVLGEGNRDAAEYVHDSAAGLIAAIQLMRESSLGLHGIIEKDADSNFDKTKIQLAYSRAISALHDELKKKKEHLETLVVTSPFYGMIPNLLEKFFANDVASLANYSSATLQGFRNQPPTTIFELPANDSSPTPGKWYYLVNKNSRRVLDVSGGKTDNMANIQQWSRDAVEQQMWKLESAGDGYYFLFCKKSNKVLATDKDNAVQYGKVSNARDQQWKLEDAGDGYFYLVNKNNKALDVDSAKLNDGANVQQYSKNYSDAQKWGFEVVYL